MQTISLQLNTTTHYVLGCLGGHTVLATNLYLSAAAAEAGRLRWPLRPKHHFFVHIINSTKSSFRNPKYYSCMLDEDLLGKVVRLAREVNRKCVANHVLWRCQLRLARPWPTSLANVYVCKHAPKWPHSHVNNAWRRLQGLGKPAKIRDRKRPRQNVVQ